MSGQDRVTLDPGDEYLYGDENAGLAEQNPPATTTEDVSSLEKGTRAPEAASSEEDIRMALRLAALRTLKSRNAKKPADSGKSSELASSSQMSGYLLSPSEQLEEIPGLAGSSAGRSVEAAASAPTPAAPLTTAPQLLEKPVGGKKRVYKDVDAPEMAVQSTSASSISYDTNGVSIPDVGRRRQRLSYADEFTTQPSAPSGELESASWLGPPLGQSTKKNSQTHTAPQRTVTVPQRPPAQSRDKPRVQAAPKRRFLDTELSRDSLVIEWSDDEEDGHPAQHEPRSSGHRPMTSATLSEKEQQIRAMTEKIRALEEQRRALRMGSAPDSRTTAKASNVLGKRPSDDTTDAGRATLDSSSKVRYAEVDVPLTYSQKAREDTEHSEPETSGSFLSNVCLSTPLPLRSDLRIRFRHGFISAQPVGSGIASRSMPRPARSLSHPCDQATAYGCHIVRYEYYGTLRLPSSLRILWDCLLGLSCAKHVILRPEK